jgi:hypothetical protein
MESRVLTDSRAAFAQFPRWTSEAVALYFAPARAFGAAIAGILAPLLAMFTSTVASPEAASPGASAVSSALDSAFRWLTTKIQSAPESTESMEIRIEVEGQRLVVRLRKLAEELIVDSVVIEESAGRPRAVVMEPPPGFSRRGP